MKNFINKVTINSSSSAAGLELSVPGSSTPLMWFLKRLPSVFHRNTEDVTVEVASRDSLLQPSLLKAGELKQTARDHFPLGFQYLQGWLTQQTCLAIQM